MSAPYPIKPPSLYHSSPSPISSLHQSYLLPLQNQYSILNQPHDPYQAIDNFAFEVGRKLQRHGHANNDSLRLEVEQWEKKQLREKNGRIMEKLHREVVKLKQL